MEIRDYRTGDENKILELFEMVFKQKMTMSYWKWRFEDNPAGKHLIKLMWDNEILIGHYAVSPVWLNIENTKMLSALSMTTMTHPDYGGLGVFGSLSNALYKKLEEELDVKAIWGFPNNNSHYGFIKNLKWNDLGQISHLALPSSKLTGSLNDNIAMFTHFGVEHGNLISKVTSQFKVAVLRDKLYLNWRYVQNPSVPYDKFEYRQNGSLLGFVVLKKYPSKIKPDVFDLFITEIGIEKENFTIISVLISADMRFRPFHPPRPGPSRQRS